MGLRHYIPWNSYDMLLRAITKPLALCTSRITISDLTESRRRQVLCRRLKPWVCDIIFHGTRMTCFCGQSQSRLRSALRVLQFLPDTQEPSRDTRYGSGYCRPRLDA